MQNEAVASLASDVGTLVEYGLTSFRTAPARYRVSGWIRISPEPDHDEADFLHGLLRDIVREFDTKDGAGKKRMEFCLREEATHLSLSGIAGAIAPVEKCKAVGRVGRRDEDIEEARASAVRLGGLHKKIY
jgi:hypothetical protein